MNSIKTARKHIYVFQSTSEPTILPQLSQSHHTYPKSTESRASFMVKRVTRTQITKLKTDQRATTDLRVLSVRCYRDTEFRPRSGDLVGEYCFEEASADEPENISDVRFHCA